MDEKTCASCGRRIKYQKRWRKTWENVRYCSHSCRREKLDKTDCLLEQSLLALLETKPTICPTEAAQAISKDWQSLHERSRRAARRLVSAGKVEMVQNGRVVDASTAKGPVRLRLR
jgi:hypothetical protein